MPQVKKFTAHKWYVVIEDHDIPEPAEPQLRLLKTFCYKLRVGMKLRFKGPNWDGIASFLTREGKQVFLTPEVAFRVVGCIEQHPAAQRPSKALRIDFDVVIPDDIKAAVTDGRKPE